MFVVPCAHRDGIPVPDLGGHVMRSSSSFLALSTVAILSTALLLGLSGTAMSQTATGSAAQLPSVTVEAPKQLARPHQAARVANTVASRRRSPAAANAHRTRQLRYWRGQVQPWQKLAAFEKTSNNCNDGCQTSFKYGNPPWNGCSGRGCSSRFRQRAETYATSKPTLSARTTGCFWVRQR